MKTLIKNPLEDIVLFNLDGKDNIGIITGIESCGPNYAIYYCFDEDRDWGLYEKDAFSVISLQELELNYPSLYKKVYPLDKFLTDEEESVRQFAKNYLKST